jgi:hypothetical protein
MVRAIIPFYRTTIKGLSGVWGLCYLPSNEITDPVFEINCGEIRDCKGDYR